MLAGLLLVEALSISLFASLLVRQQTRRTNQRAQYWLDYETTALANQSAEALEQQRPQWVDLAVRTSVESPIVQSAKIASPSGEVLFVSGARQEDAGLSADERLQIAHVKRGESRIFRTPSDGWEGIRAIYTGNDLRGYAFVTFNRSAALQQLDSLLGDTAIFAIIWIAASIVLVLLTARSIARPLAILHRGTRDLMHSPQGLRIFPCPLWFITRLATSSIPSTAWLPRLPSSGPG